MEYLKKKALKAKQEKVLEKLAVGDDKGEYEIEEADSTKTRERISIIGFCVGSQDS